MSKVIKFDKNYFIIGIFVLILVIYIIFSYYIQNQCMICNIEKDNKIKNIEDNLEKTSKKLESYENSETIINNINYPSPIINRDPKTINSLDRVYNPLRYPYKSDYYYDQSWYPDLQLPFQVIGGGYRRTPTLGGTQVPIYNPPVSIDISNDNIAPINITTRGPLGMPQQVGVLYKINGNENDVLPLFGRRKYPNDTKYEYYTMMGRYGSKVNVITKNRNDELGSNDVVFIKGQSSPYRVTIYETDFPQYIPYM
jgi:hypothetical protein